MLSVRLPAEALSQSHVWMLLLVTEGFITGSAEISVIKSAFLPCAH